jgi:hypothetical protein
MQKLQMPPESGESELFFSEEDYAAIRRSAVLPT